MAFNNNIANARAVVENGTDPNQNDRWGSTPLIIASSYGHMQLVKLLLVHGADTIIADSCGFTAQSYSRSYNYEGIIELLGRGE